MRDLRDYVTFYTQGLTGPAAGDAWHSLVEAGSEAVPLMIEAFDGLHPQGARYALLRAIAQHRSVHALRFFESLLHDGDSDIWTTALDGLVSIGGQASLAVLTRARVTATGDRCEWIDEAIEQLLDADVG